MKYAILIGINYFGNERELKGCINDVLNMRSLLKKYGYKKKNMLVLTDITNYKKSKFNRMDKKERKKTIKLTRAEPTKKNICKYIKRLVKNVRSGDKIFIHFSGHGGRTIDLDSSESDNKDEVIFTCDHNIIKDDTLKRMLYLTKEENITINCVLDCCHSGTGLDLPNKIESYSDSENGSFSDNSSKNNSYSFEENSVSSYTAKPNIYLISGCKDEQTSADAFINNEFQGALSNCLIDIGSRRNISEFTLNELKNKLKSKMKKRRFGQKPQITGNMVNLKNKRFAL